MQKSDILIIGGGPAAIVAANTARDYYPTKSVTVIKKSEKSLVPCGIPYIFGPLLQSPKDDFIPCGERAKKMGINLIIDEIVKIDFDNKIAFGKEGEEYSYEKLILATGSIPNKPKNIENYDAKGVFYVPKEADYIEKMYEKIKKLQTIAVIGTGFIGVEIAGELAKSGKKIHLIGPRLLKNAFDEEFSEQMESIMLSENITFHKNRHAKKIVLNEENKASKVLLENEEEVECEAVIMATGYRPNTKMAIDSGISKRQFDTIYVDEYMRTTKKDVFAIGDCAEKRHFITRRTIPIMLASTATAEARVAVANLYNINMVKSFSGTIGIFSTVVGDTCFASAGITEENAKCEKIPVVSSTIISDDKHPSKLPNNHKQTVKLIALKSSLQIIGAQVIGGIDTGEMINILGVIIEKRMNVFDLLNLQVATHPLLTSAPTAYPIVQAAQNIAKLRIGKE